MLLSVAAYLVELAECPSIAICPCQMIFEQPFSAVTILVIFLVYERVSSLQSAMNLWTAQRAHCSHRCIIINRSRSATHHCLCGHTKQHVQTTEAKQSRVTNPQQFPLKCNRSLEHVQPNLSINWRQLSLNCVGNCALNLVRGHWQDIIISYGYTERAAKLRQFFKFLYPTCI